MRYTDDLEELYRGLLEAEQPPQPPRNIPVRMPGTIPVRPGAAPDPAARARQLEHTRRMMQQTGMVPPEVQPAALIKPSGKIPVRGPTRIAVRGAEAAEPDRENLRRALGAFGLNRLPSETLAQPGASPLPSFEPQPLLETARAAPPTKSSAYSGPSFSLTAPPPTTAYTGPSFSLTAAPPTAPPAQSTPSPAPALASAIRSIQSERAGKTGFSKPAFTPPAELPATPPAAPAHTELPATPPAAQPQSLGADAWLAGGLGAGGGAVGAFRPETDWTMRIRNGSDTVAHDWDKRGGYIGVQGGRLPENIPVRGAGSSGLTQPAPEQLPYINLEDSYRFLTGGQTPPSQYGAPQWNYVSQYDFNLPVRAEAAKLWEDQQKNLASLLGAKEQAKAHVQAAQEQANAQKPDHNRILEAIVAKRLEAGQGVTAKELAQWKAALERTVTHKSGVQGKTADASSPPDDQLVPPKFTDPEIQEFIKGFHSEGGRLDTRTLGQNLLANKQAQANIQDLVAAIQRRTVAGNPLSDIADEIAYLTRASGAWGEHVDKDNPLGRGWLLSSAGLTKGGTNIPFGRGVSAAWRRADLTPTFPSNKENYRLRISPLLELVEAMSRKQPSTGP